MVLGNSLPQIWVLCVSLKLLTVFSEVIFNMSSQSYLQTSVDSRNIISHHLFTSDELILSNCENLIIPLARFEVQWMSSKNWRCVKPWKFTISSGNLQKMWSSIQQEQQKEEGSLAVWAWGCWDCRDMRHPCVKCSVLMADGMDFRMLTSRS